MDDSVYACENNKVRANYPGDVRSKDVLVL